MLVLHLSEDIERCLDALVKRSGHSRSYYAREAIMAYLDDLETADLSDDILQRVVTGKERTLTLDQLERELDLDR